MYTFLVKIENDQPTTTEGIRPHKTLKHKCISCSFARMLNHFRIVLAIHREIPTAFYGTSLRQISLVENKAHHYPI